jgi:FkbM family methyltransferase
MKLKELYKLYSGKFLDKQAYINSMYEKHQLLFEYSEFIKKSEIESLHIEDNYVYAIMRNTGIKLLLNNLDKRFIPIEILNFRSIESTEKEVVYNLASKCKTIFDIGANIGWYTLNFSKFLSVEKIYAFEPIPITYDYLKKHIELNNIHNAEIYNFGLSNEVAEKTFYWTKEELGSSSLTNLRDRIEIEKTVCQLNTIDNFVKNTNIKIDFIKCDVEGAELLVFQGGIETIKRDKPIIFSEMLRKWSAKFSYHPNDIIKLLSDIGYNCFTINNNKLVPFKKMTEETKETNFIFIHGEK